MSNFNLSLKCFLRVHLTMVILLDSQLAAGGLCGNVDIYDVCLRQYRYQGKFEFTYITKSQVFTHSHSISVIGGEQEMKFK
jgi:hypothetical protein